MTLLFTHLDGLLPLARPQANGCPAFVITQAARLAAVEFCERTRCWRHIIDFRARHCVTDNLIPFEAVIWEIEDASADGVPLTPTQHSSVKGDRVAIGSPRYISQTNPWGILLHPFPELPEPTGPCELPDEEEEEDPEDETVGVRVIMSVFLKPRSDLIVSLDMDDPLSDTLNVIPSWMMQQHAERLVDGALSRVLMMEGERWYNPQRAAYHRALFDKALNRNASANMRGQQRAPIRMPTSYM